jgi:hypothetical protein
MIERDTSKMTKLSYKKMVKINEWEVQAVTRCQCVQNDSGTCVAKVGYSFCIFYQHRCKISRGIGHGSSLRVSVETI